MEIRARYILVGLFTLAATAAVLLFVYWLNNAGGLHERSRYQVRFESSISGLLSGSAVLFNGLRVGEVTELRLNLEDPRQVIVLIAVEPSTPMRADTLVDIEFQGLSGAPVIALKGGSPTAPVLKSAQGDLPTLVAPASAGQSMTQAAREALRRFDTIMAENAAPLHGMVMNLNTFSDALARNANRVDSIASGLERMTGGGRAAAALLVDLTAASEFPPSTKPKKAQLAVPDPTALVMLDAQTILVRPPLPEGPRKVQWSDSLPKLLQAKVIESFESSNYLRAVSRPMEGFSADYQLLIDIRKFQVSTAGDGVAQVELAAKLLGANGRVLDARVFAADTPAKVSDDVAAARALDEAFGTTTRELVLWTAGAIPN
jgi:phospholipid/cholesterol/gamma-HCH transport system substrate-binding protein